MEAIMQPPEMKPQDLSIDKLFGLKGKVALITGASGALGAAVAKGLAVNGVDLVLSSVEGESLQKLAEEVRALGVRVLPLYCDVVNESQVNQMMDKAVEEFGKVDILFTCAGIPQRIPLLDLDLHDWRRIMDINVQGTLLCCKAVAKDMIRRGEGGSIITVGSVRGFHGHKDGYTGYGTSKAAVHYLTKTLAFEWAEHNIRVNSIAPCMFWSALTETVLGDPKQAPKYLSRIPMGRAPVPEEFVGAVIFLASNASSMVTAHILSVDGGVVGG
jgi:gluconate 5-dehydrogenase